MHMAWFIEILATEWANRILERFYSHWIFQMYAVKYIFIDNFIKIYKVRINEVSRNWRFENENLCHNILN